MDKIGACWLFTGVDTSAGIGAFLLQHWRALAGGVLLLLLAVLARRMYRRYGEQGQNAVATNLIPASLAPKAAGNDQPPAETFDPALGEQLLALLTRKETRGTATTSLLELGEAALPALQTALLHETDEQHLQRLAQVCACVGTPAARQALIVVAQSANLHGRAAALRALGNFAAVPADAPLFQRLVEEEMRLAQQLLHGMVEADAELRTAVRYELSKGARRLLGLLLQLYARQPVLDVQRGLAHIANERQTKYLQALENLIPRPLYRGLQALLGAERLRSQVQAFDELLGPMVVSEALQTTLVRRGAAAFSAWTVGVGLRQWHPQPTTVAYLYPHLQAANLLIRESAWGVLQRLPVQRPAAYDQLLADHPDLLPLLATAHGPEACVSAQQRVLLLKASPLFRETPENVLGNIVPIMQEVAFQPGQELFRKGALGASLFIVCDGEVGVFDGTQQLAVFRKGDFFGELALLDAEPRSATAVAQGAVVAFRLDQEDFYDVMGERSEVLHNVLRALCQRLRQQNEKVPFPPQQVSQ